MAPLAFLKMHGLGNDFVVIDARKRPVDLSAPDIRAIAARRSGVGCDQLIIIEPARRADAEVFMRIHNADGGEVAACGNATRCIAAWLMRQTGHDQAAIETAAGLLTADAVGGGLIAVDLGLARCEWADIPLSRPVDTLHLDIAEGPLADAVAVNVGNPHAVFFVDDAAGVDLAAVGPVVERHALFPERTNVEVAQVLDRGRLRLRVWERGTGITPACGTGAAAAVVAAVRRGLCERTAEVILDGGVLAITWQNDRRVRMTGPAVISFAGAIDPAALS